MSRCSACLLVLLLAPPAAAWEPTGGDHQMADWTLEDGDSISGLHENVGRLVIPEGATVTVLPREGDAHGFVEVRACEVVIAGHLDADAAGHRGGLRADNQGGHQGSGPGGGCGGGPGSCVGQGASGGGYGGAGGTAETETNWADPCDRCDNPTRSHCYGEAGESQGTDAAPDIDLGSGGGAGGNSCNCHGAGGPGGHGGGMVKVLVDEEATIDGEITADGETPARDDADCGYHPGGGGGSGGGILVQSPILVGGGRLSARGGRGGEADGCPSSCGDWAWAGGGGGGGRVKLFVLDNRFDGQVEVDGGSGGPAPGGGRAYAGEVGSDGTLSVVEDTPVELPGCAGPPRIRLPEEVTGREATPLVVLVEGRDPDGGPLGLAWDLDGDGEFDDAVGEEAEVVFPDDGEYPVAVEATDDEGDTAVAQTRARILNLPPVIDSDPPAQAQEGVPWTYLVEASDPAGLRDPLALELEDGPVGMEAADFTVSWVPTPAQALVGRFLVVLRVSDDDGGSVRQSFSVDVTWADSDGDGMSDGWERQFDLDPDDPGDADEDPDGDGLTNLEEFQARSDPTRAGRPDPPEPWRPEDGGWTDTATPVLTVDNAVDPDNDPLTYRFRMATDPEMRNVVRDRSGIAEEEERTSWQVRRPLTEGLRYWWQARAGDGVFDSDWSATASFTVNAVPEPPRVPRLAAPEDGALLGTLAPALQTDAVFDPDGDPVTVHFELYTDEGLLDLARDARVAQEPGAAGVAWVVDPPLDEDTHYFWRAEALDLSGLSSGWSEGRTFRINEDNTAPPAPQPLRPSDGASLPDRTVLLVVNAVEDPDGDPVRYRLELDTEDTFDGGGRQVFADLEAGMGDVVTVEISGLEDNTRYSWRVRAEDGLLSSDWVVRRFVVSGDNDPPGSPRPLRPTGGERVAPDAVELVVKAAPDPDWDPLTYHFEVATDAGFSEVVATSEPIPGGRAEQVAWTAPALEPGRSWVWRCRAVDPLRLWGPWSEVAGFATSYGGGGGEGEGEPAEGEGEGGAAEGEGEDRPAGDHPEGGDADGRRRVGACACGVGARAPAPLPWLLLAACWLVRRRG